jgi:methionine-R-sulfoxide reductase
MGSVSHMSKMLSLVALVGLFAAIVHAQEPAAEDKTAKAEVKKSAVAAKESTEEEAVEDPEKVDWSQVDWRKKLTRLQYHIMREAGTERPFRNEFWDFFKPGQYRCAGCGAPLFESDAKFDSECGWPSFDQTISDKAITEHVDLKMLQPRTEIRCRRCEAHLGHVFNDGPTDTGLRYCLNSAAMKFVSEKELIKQLKKQDEKDKKPIKAAKATENTDKKPAATVESEGEKP